MLPTVLTSTYVFSSSTLAQVPGTFQGPYTATLNTLVCPPSPQTPSAHPGKTCQIPYSSRFFCLGAGYGGHKMVHCGSVQIIYMISDGMICLHGHMWRCSCGEGAPCVIVIAVGVTMTPMSSKQRSAWEWQWGEIHTFSKETLHKGFISRGRDVINFHFWKCIGYISFQLLNGV